MERRRFGGEERQDRIAAAMQTLEQGIDGILTSDSFAQYLTTMSRFHSYSFGNVMLIHRQKPEATQVAGYQRWKQLGRQVKLGERGIKILVPHKAKIGEEDSSDETVVLRGFGVGTVFDISQTEGEPLPEPPIAQEIRASSDAGAALSGHLVRYLEASGITLTREDTKPAKGYYAPDRRLIALDTDLVGDQATKTLAHEAAHFVADHKGFIRRADAETVAEGAAFVVLNHYGVDASGYSFAYVARWAQNRQVLKRNLDAIQRTAHTLIAVIEGEDTVETSEA